MTDNQPTDLLAALPRTRPHRRSAKRGDPGRESTPKARSSVKSAARKPQSTPRSQPSRPSAPRLRQPAQPGGTPAPDRPASAEDRRLPPSPREVLGTAVGAAAELAGIGVTLGSRALRQALSRLPRP